MPDLKIIGIAGTNGSGKDSLGNILADEHGWLFISVTELLRDELQKQNLSPIRENMRELSTKWRRDKGLGVLVDKAVEIFNSKSGYQGLIIASLRNPGEVDRVHELGGRVVWVDADPKIRYKRVASRSRDAESALSFEEFLAAEQAEMQHSGDENTLSLAGAKAKADIFLTNNGTVEEFISKAQKALKLV